MQGQNPDGQADGDFMSEAKDWAGELISGQTGTGRILVSTQTLANQLRAVASSVVNTYVYAAIYSIKKTGLI